MDASTVVLCMVKSAEEDIEAPAEKKKKKSPSMLGDMARWGLGGAGIGALGYGAYGAHKGSDFWGNPGKYIKNPESLGIVNNFKNKVHSSAAAHGFNPATVNSRMGTMSGILGGLGHGVTGGLAGAGIGALGGLVRHLLR